MSWCTWVAVGLAAAVGAPLRYLVDRAITRRAKGPFPLGTFMVNLSGSFVLGFITGLVLFHAFPATPRVILGGGFCGAYTTFSTFSVESVVLAQEGERTTAAINVGLSVVFGCLVAAAGMALAGL
jgi:fluoride exporter